MTARRVSPLDRWSWAAHVPVDRVVDRALLLVLAESTNTATLKTNRAIRTLQAQLRVGQRRLVEARQRLINRGLITVHNTVRNTATTYRLNVDMADVASKGDASVASNKDASPPLLLHPSWHSVAPPLDVEPGINQGGESLDVNEENTRRLATGAWAVGPYRFPN